MKVLHTSNMSEPAFGVLRQLEAEAQSSEHLGIDFHSVIYTGRSVPGRVVEKSPVTSNNRTAFKFAYYKWLFKKSKSYDIILLRYSVYDPYQLLFILLCRKPIYSVHHTLEVPELSVSTSFSMKLKTTIERLLGPVTLSLVDGIVAVLPEILDYEMERRLIKRSIPHKVYANGIDYYERTDLTTHDEDQLNPKDSAPELLFVSSVFQPWQGLEELFDEARKNKAEFLCHVVGELTKEQLSMLETDNRFCIHGLQDKTYISNLIARCDLGLSILAAHKKNMKNIPALKVREYLMEGLAVYAGHGDVLPDNFEYYKNGPIELNTILKTAKNSRSNDRTVVSETARPYIEKELLLKDLHSFLLQSHKTS